jgi:uncharacterized protein YggE
MEAQYFDSEPKNDNVIQKVLMVVGIIFLLVLIIYTFIAMQNTSKQTKYIGTSSNSTNTINISETASVYAVPDSAKVAFTVIAKGSSIGDVMTVSTNQANSVLDFLKRQNIDTADMQTTDFNVYPVYAWQTSGVDTSVYPLGKRVVTSYQATKTIMVNVKDTSQAGNIIQGAVAAGASQVSNLGLSVYNEDEYKQQARDLAIASAKTKATAIAKSLGVSLGDATGYTESYVTSYDAATTATTGTGANMLINVGENKIQATVNISYQIK